MREISHREDLRPTGRYRLRFYAPGTIAKLEGKSRDEQKALLNELVPLRELSFSNRVVDTGLVRTLNVYAGLETALELDTLQIGTGVGAVVAGDTALGTLVASVPRSLRELTGTELLLTYFVPDALLPVQEYTEIGIRLGPEGAGPLFSRALLSPTYDKSVSEDLIAEYTLSLANA